MQFPHGELVTVSRTGEQVRAGWDPSQNKLYAEFGEDVVQGDMVSFLGGSFRVTGVVEPWRSPFTGWAAGSVVTLEADPLAVPDTAVLYRLSPVGPFDRTLNRAPDPVREELWSGPVAVNPAADSSAAGVASVGEQRVTMQTFRVVFPLDVVDIRPDDVLVVTSSRDFWLSPEASDAMLPAREVPLTVVRVLGGTDAVQREVLAVLNEG